MKMVAVARLQKAQSRAAAARPYADEMFTLMGHLAASGGDVEHPLLETRIAENIGILLITSDKGMSGSYNTNINRKVLDLVRRYPKHRVKLITVGKKSTSFFKIRGYDVVANFAMPSSEITMTDARDISRTIRELFESAKVDVVHLVYTKFVSAITQKVTVMQILPASTPAGKDSYAAAESYDFEPTAAVLLGSLLPKYVDTQIYRAMIESLASEHGARMTAMSSATDNAGEMIDRLTLEFNRARQSAITTELAEIVSGAEASK